MQFPSFYTYQTFIFIIIQSSYFIMSSSITIMVLSEPFSPRDVDLVATLYGSYLQQSSNTSQLEADADHLHN